MNTSVTQIFLGSRIRTWNWAQAER